MVLLCYNLDVKIELYMTKKLNIVAEKVMFKSEGIISKILKHAYTVLTL